MKKQDKFVGWLLGNNPFPFFQDFNEIEMPDVYGQLMAEGDTEDSYSHPVEGEKEYERKN